MMNCISVPGRDRYNARVVDANTEDDDDSVQEFYRAHPCILEKEKAQQMESVLENAITMAERSSGSIICLQQMTEMNAVELGRRISTFRSMKDYEESKEEADAPHALSNLATLTTSRSMQSAASLPTFLKVERGNPAILTQKSWDTISRTDSESEEDQYGSGKKKTTAAVVTPTRSWNKLRQTLSKEERTAKQESKRSLARASGSSGRRSNLFSRKKSETRPKSFANDIDVEVSLQSETKKGWGSRLRGSRRQSKKESDDERRRSKNPVQEVLPLTPALIPMEISREAEEEDFFLNDNSNADRASPVPINDISMEEEQNLEDSIQYEEEPVSMEEKSIEVMNHGSCFDIIGASNILKGLETSWKELTEDNFDVVPRRQ
jgi:hypothetical protein